MLEKQMWMQFAPELYTEWKQLKDEGKRVDQFEEVCKLISKWSTEENLESIATQIADKMAAVSVDADYPYFEPSDLEGIKAVRGIKRHSFKNNLTDEQVVDKIKGAWQGRISGCLLGKPVECFMLDRLNTLLKKTGNYPLHRYITANEFTNELIKELNLNTNYAWADVIGGIMPVDDDTNYTVFSLKLIEDYGLQFTPNDVLEAWLRFIPMFATCTAERVAYKNAASGLYAPDTASYKNPYREWIGAQIRGDFYGYINIGSPEKAAELAWRDASISHIKNGIYGEMFISAMLAAASVCDDVKMVIEAGVDEIPEKSRLREKIEFVMRWYHDGLDFNDVVEKIHNIYDEKDSHGWCHTIPNAMIVVAAMLYGNKDLGKSICLAVSAAFDTDCNGATVGSIIGMLCGANNIDSYWTNAFNNHLKTSTDGYNNISVDELVNKTIKIVNLCK